MLWEKYSLAKYFSEVLLELRINFPTRPPAEGEGFVWGEFYLNPRICRKVLFRSNYFFNFLLLQLLLWGIPVGLVRIHSLRKRRQRMGRFGFFLVALLL